MGTRSNTVVIETGHDKPYRLVNMYRQFDGYPSGHGKELAEFLNTGTMVNGMSICPDQKLVFNGAGCLAAQMVAHFKTEPGGIYLQKPTAPLDEEYAYIISANTFEPSKGIWVVVKAGRKTLFKGTPHAFAVWCEKSED